MQGLVKIHPSVHVPIHLRRHSLMTRRPRRVLSIWSWHLAVHLRYWLTLWSRRHALVTSLPVHVLLHGHALRRSSRSTWGVTVWLLPVVGRHGRVHGNGTMVVVVVIYLAT